MHYNQKGKTEKRVIEDKEGLGVLGSTNGKLFSCATYCSVYMHVFESGRLAGLLWGRRS